MKQACYCLGLGMALMMSRGMQDPLCDGALPMLPPTGRAVGVGLGPYVSMRHQPSAPCVSEALASAAAPAASRPAARRPRDPAIGRLKRIFLQEGIPGELVWIAEVESAMNPLARSRSGALGLFQLMPETARRFGLRTGVFDERLNPEKSARAAARYLKMLHREFGSWPLAIAGYNAGEGCVERALTAWGVSSFRQASPYLPQQTQSYVPRVLALVGDREGLSPDRLPRPSRREG